MNPWASQFCHSLLIALLLGSEWCTSAQSSELLNSGHASEVAPSVSSGPTFSKPQVVLSGRAITLGRLVRFSRLPQDSGHVAASACPLRTSARWPWGHSLHDDWPAVTEATLLLQHTRLQL
jgi:hypothetical protein